MAIATGTAIALAAGVGAGTSLIGANQAGSAQRGANQTNRDIAEQNQLLAKEQFDAQLAFNQEQNEIQRALAELIIYI